MTTLTWVLLGFALWTLLLLAGTVGVHRWKSILTGQARVETYAEYALEGPAFYRRALRAHANCVENLPVLASLVLVISLAGIEHEWLNTLGIAVLAARLPHSLVHVSFPQTTIVLVFRFLFFAIQWFAMIAMAVLTVWLAWPPF